MQRRIQEILRKANDKASKVAFANEAPLAEVLQATASTSLVVDAGMRFPEAAFGEPGYGTIGWRSIRGVSRVLDTVLKWAGISCKGTVATLTQRMADVFPQHWSSGHLLNEPQPRGTALHHAHSGVARAVFATSDCKHTFSDRQVFALAQML